MGFGDRGEEGDEVNSVDCGEEEVGEREFGIEKGKSFLYLDLLFFSWSFCILLISFLYTFFCFLRECFCPEKFSFCGCLVHIKMGIKQRAVLRIV